MRFIAILFGTIALTFGTLADTRPLMAVSPHSALAIHFELEHGKPVYRVTRFGQPVILPSQMGFVLKDAPALDRGFRILRSSNSSFDETWTQVWGEAKNIRNQYNELRVELQEEHGLQRRVTVVFRAFDDGIGFRYEFPKQKNLQRFAIIDELTEFALAGNHDSWWIGAYQWNRYEYLYRQTPVNDILVVHTPYTMATANGLFLSIHEAALYDYASMTLRRTGPNRLKADLVPWSDGTRVKTSTPMHTPWRTIQIADTPGGLITSYLILNLNEPNKIKDTSWIEPAKYVGIWWEMHLNTASWASGKKHGATTANTKRYIDFAAQHGFGGVLVEGWNIGWDGDWIANSDSFSFTRAYPDFDIAWLADYAQKKGTRLIGHHETSGGIANYERQMKEAYALYKRLGIRAVKTGYVRHGQEIRRIDENGNEQYEWHHGQFMVQHYQKSVEEAAKQQVMVNVHEPIKDTGIRRTWPNLMSREGARGQEFNAWGENGGNPPEHTVLLPFTRLLAGPMDFTPGIFDLLFPEAKPENRVNTTLAKQLALYVIIYSPLQMAADLPQNYETKPQAFQFIVDVPVDWEETRVLNADIGNYLTVVRKDRNSADWYLGSISDEEGRVLEVPLGFLQPGLRYTAQIYRDGSAASWKENPYDIAIEQQSVDSGMSLELRLASGGGTAIRFKAE